MPVSRAIGLERRTGGLGQETPWLPRWSNAWVGCTNPDSGRELTIELLASRALVVVTDKEEVLAYTLPRLELITRFKLLPLDSR